MKIAHKIAFSAAGILFITTVLLSVVQVSLVRHTLYTELNANITATSSVLARQIENWLTARLQLIDLMAQTIDSDYSPENTQRVFNAPLLKSAFVLVFGALESDGKPIKNLDSWQPGADWDGRQRPWFPIGKQSTQAQLTEPYLGTPRQASC